MKLHVSDHAILRFIERSYGVSTEDVRSEIEGKVSAAVAMGAVSATIEGITYILKDNTVVTALPCKQTTAGKRHSWPRGNGVAK